MKKKFLIIIFSALTAIVVATVAAITINNERLLKENALHRQMITASFASSAIETGLSNGLVTFIKKTMEGLELDTSFNAAITYDSDLTPILTLPKKYSLPTHVEAQLINWVSDTQFKQQTVHDKSMSFHLLAFKDHDDEVLGYFLLSFDNSIIEQEIIKSIQYASLSAILITLPIMLAISWQISRMIVPILVVIRNMKKLANGELTEKLVYSKNDEIGTLVASCNSMVVQIEHQKQAVSENIERVQSAQREAELQRTIAVEASKAKGDFLANMSHEIRTPMNGVVGTAGLLLNTDLSVKQRDYAETMKKSGEALLELINDILDLSKIEAGKMDLELVPMDLEEVIEHVTNMVRPLSKDKGLELLIRYPFNTVRFVLGDAGRIRQILLNLISNAIKFTEDGHVVIGVNSKAIAGDKIVFTIEVEDTGIGIPKDKLDHVFNVFGQADSSTTRRFGGTGLGLSICKQFAEMMDGGISVTSVLGKGSMFILQLVLSADPDDANKESNTCADLNGLRLLIVDDCKMSRLVLGISIKYTGIYYEEVNSAVVALERLEQAVEKGEPFDFVITDHMMPELTGLSFSKIVKDSPTLKDIATLMIVTSTPKDISIGELQDIGVSGFLHKPARPSIIPKMIKRLQEAKEKKLSIPLLTQNMFTIQEEDNADEGITDFTGTRVLVVEDNASNMMIARAILEDHHNCSVTPAGNGIEGVGQFRRKNFDIIFMDCQMPELNGFEATQLIREIELNDPIKKHTPIIAFTANAMMGDKEKCLEAGMDDFITKPVKLEMIAKMLNVWVAGRQAIPEKVGPTDSNPLSNNRKINYEILDDLHNTLKYRMNGFIDEYLETSEKLLSQLKTGINDKDYGVVRATAHQLRAPSGQLGALSFAEILDEMELCAKNDPADTEFGRYRELLESLDATYTQVKNELISFQSTL